LIKVVSGSVYEIGSLQNGVSEDAEKTTSRFSRWFKKDSPTKEVGGSSRKSSIQEDNHIIKVLPMFCVFFFDKNVFFYVFRIS